MLVLVLVLVGGLLEGLAEDVGQVLVPVDEAHHLLHSYTEREDSGPTWLGECRSIGFLLAYAKASRVQDREKRMLQRRRRQLTPR